MKFRRLFSRYKIDKHPAVLERLIANCGNAALLLLIVPLLSLLDKKPIGRPERADINRQIARSRALVSAGRRTSDDVYTAIA